MATILLLQVEGLVVLVEGGSGSTTDWVIQGQFYSAVDLGELAQELDSMERVRMAEVLELCTSAATSFVEMGEDSPEYRQFIQQPSSNMDDSGFFSVQVSPPSPVLQPCSR